MTQAYTLEDFRRDLTHFAQLIEKNDHIQLADLRRILSVIEAIPPAERESGSPFLTPSLLEQIAQASKVSVQNIDEILAEYKRLAGVVTECKRRYGTGS